MYNLRKAVENEGYKLVLDNEPSKRSDKVHTGRDTGHKWAQLCKNNTIACVGESWLYAEAVAYELSIVFIDRLEDRRNMQVKLLGAWLNGLAEHHSKLNHTEDMGL